MQRALATDFPIDLTSFDVVFLSAILQECLYEMILLGDLFSVNFFYHRINWAQMTGHFGPGLANLSLAGLLFNFSVIIIVFDVVRLLFSIFID